MQFARATYRTRILALLGQFGLFGVNHRSCTCEAKRSCGAHRQVRAMRPSHRTHARCSVVALQETAGRRGVVPCAAATQRDVVPVVLVASSSCYLDRSMRMCMPHARLMRTMPSQGDSSLGESPQYSLAPRSSAAVSHATHVEWMSCMIT